MSHAACTYYIVSALSVRPASSLYYKLTYGIYMYCLGAKGAVCGLRSAHFAGECALLKPEKCHLFLPSPIHACPRHGPQATSSDG